MQFTNTTNPFLLMVDASENLFDPAGRQALERLLQDLEATILVTIQDETLVRRMDEVWFIDNGRVVEVGSPNLLLDGGGPTRISSACRHHLISASDALG